MFVTLCVVTGAMATVRLIRDHTSTVLLATDAAMIAGGAEKYFRAQCSSGALPIGVTTSTLVSQNFLTNAPQAPWGATWSVSFVQAPPRVLVSASVAASAVVAGEIGQETQAVQVSGTTLTWSTLVRLAPTTSSAYNMLFEAMYETPNC